MIRLLLTLLLALQLALAPMAQATAAHGGGDKLKGSFITSVVALGLADVQTGIGDVFAREGSGGEGSLGHVLLHGLAGCAAAEAQGADCAAGAAGGIAQAVFSGLQTRPDTNDPAALAAWKADLTRITQTQPSPRGRATPASQAHRLNAGCRARS